MPMMMIITGIFEIRRWIKKKTCPMRREEGELPWMSVTRLRILTNHRETMMVMMMMMMMMMVLMVMMNADGDDE